jgi:cell wall-associated NlpC family hydrolase
MERLHTAGRKPRKARYALLLLPALLMLLLAAAGAARAEERHTAVFRCGGGGLAGRQEEGTMASILLEPVTETVSEDGRAWSLEELRGLPGFRLEGAALRFTVTAVRGYELSYTLICGRTMSMPQCVRPGKNLWDVTEPLQAWMESPEEKLYVIPVYEQSVWGMRAETGSFSLQLTFSAEARLPDFPLDRVRYHSLYETSLCMLEEGNPFVSWYDETADSLMEVSLPLGVPYYYAGGSEDKFLRRFIPSTTTNYYQETHMYLCGLDCVGMTRMVYEKCGLERHPSISDILRRGAGSGALGRNDPSRWYMFLRPGDLIAVKHGTFHVMMYLGTMRQFGLKEADAGEAADLLDWPLVIHCGGNPFYYDRYQVYIREMGYRNTWPPDGGVTVSVIRRTDRDAPNSVDTSWGKHFGWYLMKDDQPLLVFRLEDCTDLAWYGPEKLRD